MSTKSRSVVVRPLALSDVPRILELEKECFPGIPADRHWKPEMLEAHITKFPEGQWGAEQNGALVGSCTNLRVRLADAVKQHRWTEIAGGGYITTHLPDGNALYGTEIMVHPEARRQGIAKKLYQARKDYILEQGMAAFISGGRIPGYSAVADRMPVAEYVARVIAGLQEDRVLTPQMKAGMRVAGILENYLTDPRSMNYATILLWRPGWLPQPKPEELNEVGHE
jgi:ribosomal protein S18 acetylase RimI-like enzyme